eukprot:CAMPEP_0171175604 /NCGR_PEP_ID=MMETSP0790-20130122/11312_1 /TAXON_ID=2925 /ORGANISM="Alexandrium catenella, Strain OF101" /LENGTH=124 /DNA_ID=CAMNT_0011640481 /DNA_START=154 /DNA_END=524 /DNA_ORIENTATION=+
MVINPLLSCTLQRECLRQPPPAVEDLSASSEKPTDTQESVVLTPTSFSMPQAESTATIVVLPASKALRISSCTFLSSSVGSPCWMKHGKFRSSLVPPSSRSKLTSPLSASALSNWYSVRFTKGT